MPLGGNVLVPDLEAGTGVFILQQVVKLGIHASCTFLYVCYLL